MDDLSYRLNALQSKIESKAITLHEEQCGCGNYWTLTTLEDREYFREKADRLV